MDETRRRLLALALASLAGSAMAQGLPKGPVRITSTFPTGSGPDTVARMVAEKLQAQGKAVDFKELLRMEPDGGTTNIRNVKSKHWTRWLGTENRCVVPFNSFSEFNKAEGGDIWFALDETRPLACFAGIWTNWTSVRKVKEGETTNDLYAFLTTEPNAEVGAIHPKAMPVILTTPDEVETWMTAPADEVLKLQRPLPDGSLRVVARGVKEDPIGPTT